MSAATFADAIRAAGFEPPASIEPGKFHRFATNGKKQDKAGYCKLFPDGDAGIIGDWRTGERIEWHAERSAPLSPGEAAERRRQIEEAAREMLALRDGEQRKAAERARTIWNEATPAPADHAYLLKKRIPPDGLRLDVDGRLVVPVRAADGEAQSVQFIAPSGEKRFLPGGKMAGGWACIGTPADGAPVLLAEGWATAATLHQATGRAVVVAFNAGNLSPVAKMIRSRWPGSPVVVCGDDDQDTAGNPGRTKATEAARAVGGVAVFPTFAPESSGSDFNDMAAESGLEAIGAIIESAVRGEHGQARAFRLVPVSDLLREPRPHDWLIRGYLEGDSLALLFGDPAAGKSLLAMDWAASIATGREWGGCRVKAGPVIYLAGEGHHGLSRRMKAWETITGQSLGDAPLFVSTGRAGMPSEVDAIMSAADAAVAKHGKPLLLVVDTLARHIEGDENAAPDMSRFIAACDDLRLRYGCAVLVVHHSGHGDKARARAHSALPGAVDCNYSLLKDAAGVRELACTKAKDFEPPAPRHFTVKAARLPPPWFDEDGELLEAPILETSEAPAGSAKREPMGRQMPASARIAADALEWALKEKGSTPPAEVLKEAGKGNLAMAWGRVVHLEFWRDRFYATCGDDDPGTRKKAFQRGREWLQQHAKAKILDSWAWAPLAPLPGHSSPMEIAVSEPASDPFSDDADNSL